LFVIVAGLLASFVALMVPVLGGDRTARRILLAGLLVVILQCVWFGWQLRRDEGYTLPRANVFTFVCLFTTYTAIWFFGLFSPAVAVIAFGLAFFSLGQSRGAILGAYATSAGFYLLLALGVLTGLIGDRGLVASAGLSRPQQITIVGFAEATLLATYLLGRRTRQAAMAALEGHDRAIRSLAHRNALLREARHELAHAMQAGGVGRWTDEIVGGFRIGRLLGRGAMGEVYEAARSQGGEMAAIKLLHPHVLAQPDFVHRFVREARVVASLDVPNVVRVLEVSPSDARVPYLVMERLLGRDLGELLREHKRMGIRSVLTMVRQVGLGLDAARAAGIVHRDLKPRNLFCARDGVRELWKILDFGVARVTGDETLTHNQIVGTPNYMAPEQANGTGVTHQTDLFALGVIAYRALTGHPAFEGENTAEILYKVVHSMPLRPSLAAPLGAELDLALAIAMAKDPADRFSSAAELAHALEGAASERLEAGFRARAERLLAERPWTEAPD
jgi:serine/threonine-protein kinase